MEYVFPHPPDSQDEHAALNYFHVPAIFRRPWQKLHRRAVEALMACGLRPLVEAASNPINLADLKQKGNNLLICPIGVGNF